MADTPPEKIAGLIRPCVYYNEKAKKLKAFLTFLGERHRGDLSLLLALSVDSLREELLTVRGIGEETADAIILYAANKPSFVIDAYTRRILERLGLAETKTPYEHVRDLFMHSLPADVPLYNEYHALLVRHGKDRCRLRQPLCSGCPLQSLCRFS